MTGARAPRKQGKVRMARLTDLAALGELSRLCQSDDPSTRSLGLPVSGPPIGVFSLFRLPLGAFRPNDLMYVYEEGGRISGLIRVERESTRDEWTIVELDAVGMADAGDIRYRLVNQLLREGARRGAARFHVACADADGNVELMMQAGFMRYGEERIMFRPAEELPKPWTDKAATEARIRPAQPIDALALNRLYAAATPGPVARLEAIPAARLGASGQPFARPALEPRTDPAIRRYRGLRAGLVGRRQGWDRAGRVRPGRCREGGPAALFEGRRTAGCRLDRTHRLRTRHHRGTHDEGQ